MPAKGSKLITGDRQPVLTRKLFTKYKKDNPKSDIKDFKLFKEIFDTVNEVKADFILETMGYKTEYGGSIIIVNKYKTKKRLCDYHKTRKYGKYIPYNNDHSHDYKHIIRWYSSFDRYKNFRLMYFYPLRGVKRRLAQFIKSNSVSYQNWEKSDFRAVKHLQKLLD